MSTFTAVFQRDGDGWMAYVEELPGANTHGRTLAEARKDLREAVKLIVAANRELAREEARGKEVKREKLLVAV